MDIYAKKNKSSIYSHTLVFLFFCQFLLKIKLIFFICFKKIHRKV